MANSSSSTAHHNKHKGEWSETCIGLWSKSTLMSKGEYKDTAICKGINLVKIKNMDVSAVKPTNTVGIQIILHDTEVPTNPNTLPTSSELSVTEQIYTSYGNNFSDVKYHWDKLKDNSKNIADAVKTFSFSPNKFEKMNKFVTREYNDLRNWMENYWK